MLAIWVLTDHHSVVDSAAMFLASGILAFVILHDELLLSVFDALPIGLELYIKDGVASKNWLRRSGSESGVHCVVDGRSDCAQNTFEIPFGIDVIFVPDLEGSNHVVHRLVHAFHDSVSLWVASSDEFLLETVL